MKCESVLPFSVSLELDLGISSSSKDNQQAGRAEQTVMGLVTACHVALQGQGQGGRLGAVKGCTALQVVS